MFLRFWIVLVFKQICEFGDFLDIKFSVQQYKNQSSDSVSPKNMRKHGCMFYQVV